MGLLVSFFVAMALGILWGAIEAWSEKLGYFVLIIAAFYILSMFYLTGGVSPGIFEQMNWGEALVTVVGFWFGHGGSKASYQQAFEEDND